MNDIVFRILAALIFVMAAAISITYRRRADRAGGERISLKEEGLVMTLSLRLLGLTVWALIFAYLLNPAWVAWARFDLPEWARWVGVLMGVGSVLLAYWVFRSLGNNVTPTVVTRAKHSLVTSGPYRWVRHPLYSMGLLAYLGFSLLSENWLIALLAVLGFILLRIRLIKEEAHLIATFGDEYRAYMQRTGTFLPRL